jgi:iron complex transport system ATP-binding protein
MLQTHHVTLTVGERLLVQDLHWRMNAGEFWCIIGKNGAGKSTLLRSLAGLLTLPDQAGQIMINDLPLAQWPLVKLAQLRSYLPQERHDAFAYRVLETVLAARYPYQLGQYWESEADVQLAYAALAELDVANLAKRDVRNLSGGERQRVAIAAVLAQNAACMLLDEPVNALDLSHQVSVMALMAERCRQQNKVVAMVSHDVNLAFRYATHVLLLMPGGAWQAGPVRQIMTEAALTQCLQHPIQMLWQGEQGWFSPLSRSRERGAWCIS